MIICTQGIDLVDLFPYRSFKTSLHISPSTDSFQISAVRGLKISHAHEARRDVPANVRDVPYEVSEVSVR